MEANDLAVQEYGYSRAELLSSASPTFCRQKAAAYLDTAMAALRDESASVRESSHRRKDGSVFPVEVSEAAISLDGRKYYQAIVRDISERKRAEEDASRQ